MDYPYSLDDYINEVIEFMKSKGINRPDVIAHSFGGRIAIKMAYNDPRVFNKIVLTGSAGLKPRTSLRKRLKSICFKVLKKFIKKEKLEWLYASDYRALSPVMKESFIKIVNEHLDYCLCKIKNPTLIINGENDEQTPLYMAKKLNANIKNSKMVILKRAGHFCFIDSPLSFNMEVREFLLS